MTPAEMAAAIGVSVPTICRWQRPGWWSKKGKRNGGIRQARSIFEKLSALANGQGSTEYSVPGKPSIISINLQINPFNLDNKASQGIRAVRAILDTLEKLAEDK